VTLGREDALQHRIDQRRGHRLVAAFAVAQPPGDPRGGDQRIEQRVEVAHVPHAEPARIEGGAERAGGVAALVMMGDVVGAPHPGGRRHGQHHPSAGRELAAQHAERAMIVPDMLQHVEQQDQVVMPVLQMHPVRQHPALDMDARPPAGERAGLGVGLDRVDMAHPLKHRQVRAGARAHLQYLRVRVQRHLIADQRGDDPPPRRKPPMFGIYFRHAVIDGPIHQPAIGWSEVPIVSRTT